MKAASSKENRHSSREEWLRAATGELRPYFSRCGFPVPENIRFAIAFPSTGRHGKRVGECWHSSTSEDGNFEIIIRADLAEPVEVLGVLVHELIHAVLPADAGHGKLFREAAIKIGLEGQMRHALPNQLLRPRIVEIAETLGPLPHAKLNIDRNRDGKLPADMPKKQKSRHLKAECSGLGCGYNVRVVAKWADEIGPPHCPIHGPMTVIRPPAEEPEAEEREPAEIPPTFDATPPAEFAEAPPTFEATPPASFAEAAEESV